MFGISGEHILVLLVIFLIFGPKRLPEVGANLGKAIKSFKDSLNKIETETQKEVEVPKQITYQEAQHENKHAQS